MRNRFSVQSGKSVASAASQGRGRGNKQGQVRKGRSSSLTSIPQEAKRLAVTQNDNSNRPVVKKLQPDVFGTMNNSANPNAQDVSMTQAAPINTGAKMFHNKMVAKSEDMKLAPALRNGGGNGSLNGTGSFASALFASSSASGSSGHVTNPIKGRGRGSAPGSKVG